MGDILITPNIDNEEQLDLDLTEVSADQIKTGITPALTNLIDKQKKKLVIKGEKLSIDQVKLIIALLRDPARKGFTLEINLPVHLQNTSEQIELDNIISNHQHQENIERISGNSASSSPQKPIEKKPVARSIPKKIKPKIDITLFEEPLVKKAPSDIDESGLTQKSVEQAPPKSTQLLKRSPLPEQIVREILIQEGYQEKRIEWGRCTERSRALAFRSLSLFPSKTSPVNKHPLHYLLREQQDLKGKLKRWSERLGLDTEQYNALLDVYGQYGAEGLNKLFATWENYNSYERSAFIETHKLLFKDIPTYAPFIASPQFNEIIKGIATLGEAKLSWWYVLVKNHQLTKSNPKDLVQLYTLFMEKISAIEQLGLTFKRIDGIKELRSLPETLSDMQALLEKCDPANGDRAKQWDCINRVPVSKQQHYSFIIPEMELDNPNVLAQDLDGVKELFKKGAVECSLEVIKPAFYRYLAVQKQRLSLADYQNFLDTLAQKADPQNPIHKLSERAKIGMAYILAKTTSTDLDLPIDTAAVVAEWRSFEERLVKVEYLDRLRANRDYLARVAFSTGIQAGGGENQVRVEVLEPLLEMPQTPLLSYLNKLLKLSEYRFLDASLTILTMREKQKKMMEKMAIAADLYTQHPETALQAIRLVKTETVAANAQGRFFPEPQDIDLLEKFINTANALTANTHNKMDVPELNPQRVLFPLLTVFHLEYEEKSRIEGLIVRYKERISQIQANEKHLKLFSYGLLLLQSIEKRTVENQSLTADTLNKIQDELLELVASPDATRKEIRKWMDEKYGVYFGTNLVLKTNEAVNINDHLDAIHCNQLEIRQAISELIGIFDKPDETQDHLDLATSLAGLEKVLPLEQVKDFFTYCSKELQSGGLFDRGKQDIPPNYLKQFKSLIDTLIAHKSFEEFERYMSMVRESSPKGIEVRNSLGKCGYLLNTLYPAFISEGIARKEAFHFSTALVFHSPLSAFRLVHPNSKSFTEDQTQQKLSDLARAISDFNRVKQKTPADLDVLKQAIEVIIELNPKDSTAFAECRALRQNIEEVIENIKKRHAEHNKKWFFSKAFSNLKKFAISYSPSATREEVAALSQGLEALPRVNEGTHKDIKAINTRFQDVGISLYTKKEKLIEKYSNISRRANDFISRSLRLSPDNIPKKHDDLCQLIDNFLELDDQNLVLSLMYHYCGGQYGAAADLIELFNLNQWYKELSLSIKKDFIKAVIAQMNNGVTCSKEDINAFLKFIYDNKNNQKITDHLHDYYQHAPFPPLSRFMSWNHDSESHYQDFDKNPCGPKGREQENGFKKKEAERIVKKIPEIQGTFNERYLKRIHQASEKAKTESTKDLIETLTALKNHRPIDHVTMVMYSAELMHRCKGRTPLDNGFGKPIAGRSFELNTTQIIAILSMLEKGNKVTAEIGTGEGKSRIMMIMNACQFLKGNTVDFLTSNLALAERDYLESLPFFHSLGAEVNFITASSKIKDYRIGGINISDPENLCLFRNKAMSQNKADKVLDPDINKRALLLDEADVAYFDVWNMKYNYSAFTPKSSIDLLPLYPLLMDFFAQEGSEEQYKGNKQRCTELLLAYIHNKNPSLDAYVKTLSISRLEKLQDAAYTARHLKYNEDYSIVTEAVTETPLGDKKVAAAMCRLGSRINKNARFSEGVHQCLHAEFNRLLRSASTESIDHTLQWALDKCKRKGRTFTIEPEREISYSSSANSMLQDYSEGSIHAVTGTIGSSREQEEAKSTVKTEFVRIPRHKGMRRSDRPIRITENENAHLDALVAHIIESRKKKQPVLLICKDDGESQALCQKLEDRLGKEQLRRIHAATDYEDDLSEAAYIKNEAGKPGQVTIATEMVGRGTDIELQDDSHHAGLKVLLTYLPEGERDYGQIIGRSGRYGAIGETQMVLNLEALRRDLGINKFNPDFYRNPEEFIKRMQVFSSYTKDLHRLFSIAFDNHLIRFKTLYESMLPEDLSLHAIWPQFLDGYRKIQEQSELAIKIQLEGKKPDPQKIHELLREHAKEALKCWNGLIPQQIGDEASVPPADIKAPILLTKWLKALDDLPYAAKELVTVTVKIKVKVYDKYDSALAGRMHILKNAGEGGGWLADYRAWRKGEGTLFPNLESWWEGELSARNLVSQFPVLRWFIKPIEEEHEVEREVPSSYAQLFAKNVDFMGTGNKDSFCASDEGTSKERIEPTEKLVQPVVLNPLRSEQEASESNVPPRGRN